MKTTHSLKLLARPLVAAMALAGLAGLTAFGLAGCNSAQAPAAPQQGGATPISAASVVERAITETQQFSGRLEAIEHVDIRARVGGYITAVNFKPGSEVKKGDILFEIDPRPFQAELSRTEAAVASARAKAELAKLELNRSEKLLAEKAIAQREFDEKASGLKELDANVRAAQAQYDLAKLNLAYSQVRAPINGRVGKADITLGNLVDGSAILTTLVSLERIYASFDGDEDTFLRVGALSHQGKSVAVKVGLANESGFPHEGKLEFVDNQLDPRTGSVRMRAIFANADHVLAPGLFARIELDGGNGGKELTRAILISERAIGTDQNRKFVFVVGADNKAEYRPVTLGPVFDGLRVVRDGLKAGEKIVVNGLQRVRPGAPLAPQMVAMDFDPANQAAPAKPAAKVAAEKPDADNKLATASAEVTSTTTTSTAKN